MLRTIGPFSMAMGFSKPFACAMEFPSTWTSIGTASKKASKPTKSRNHPIGVCKLGKLHSNRFVKPTVWKQEDACGFRFSEWPVVATLRKPTCWNGSQK